MADGGRRLQSNDPTKVYVWTEMDSREAGRTAAEVVERFGQSPPDAHVSVEARDEYGDPFGFVRVTWTEDATDEDRAVAAAATEAERQRKADLVARLQAELAAGGTQ